jgi:cholesterol oxidase
MATDAADRVSLRFRETFGGRLAFGADDETGGADAAHPDGFPISALAHMTVDDIGYYVASPDHELECRAQIHCDALGGVRPAEGWVRLNTDVTGPDDRRMTYVLHFTDGAGHPLTLLSVKRVHNDPGFDLWSDTTMFLSRVLRGHLGFDDLADDGALPAETVAAGIMTMTLLAFTRSLLTYRPSGPTLGKSLAGLIRFDRTFLGKLWDIYASKLSTYSPF